MSFKIAGRKDGSDHGAASAAEHASHGGLFATLLSGVALVISGLSYYESSMKTADLSVYVPPMIHYARDGRDVFNIPITISNEGARTGTVLNMELDVEKLTGGEGMKNRRFHAAFLGEYPQGEEKTESRSFAPLAIAGHSTFTQTVRFYPMDNDDGVLIDDKGDFRFTLNLQLAAPPDPGLLDRIIGGSATPPLVFEMTLPYLAIQHLSFRNGTQALFNKEWKSSTSFGASQDRRAPETKAPESEAKPQEVPKPEPQSVPAAPAPEKKAEAAPPPAKPAAQKIEIIPEKPATPPPADPKTTAKPAQPQKH